MEEDSKDLGDGLEGRRETPVSAWGGVGGCCSALEFRPSRTPGACGEGSITAIGAGWNLMWV